MSIYTKIDTYSVILYSASIRDVISYLDLSTQFLDDVSKNSYAKHEVKTGDTFVWSSNGIRFECRYDEYNLHYQASSIFDVTWTYLRIYLSSEGLDFIENSHSDIEGYSLQILFSDPDFWTPISEFHKVTRCDFAFDYINENAGEFQRLFKIISNADFNSKLSSCGRLINGSTPGGLSYSYHGGAQRTIYIGSPGSERLLRIYDKRYQYTDPSGNFNIENVPQRILDDNVSIDSWYRLELQARSTYAEPYLISSQGDFRYIMGEIAAQYDIRTSDGKTIAPLHKIYLNSKRVPIIQNANCRKPKNEAQVASSWVSNIALRKIVDLIGIYGWEGFRNIINSGIKYKMSQNTQKRILYLSAQNSDLVNMAIQEGLVFDEYGNIGDLYKADDGAFYLRPFPQYKNKNGPYVR